MELSHEGSGSSEINPKWALAQMVIVAIDSMPPERLIDPSSEFQSFGEGLALLAVDDPEFALNALANGINRNRIAPAVIKSLRSNGQRVGPFRSRKIRKIISSV